MVVRYWNGELKVSEFAPRNSTDPYSSFEQETGSRHWSTAPHDQRRSIIGEPIRWKQWGDMPHNDGPYRHQTGFTCGEHRPPNTVTRSAQQFIQPVRVVIRQAPRSHHQHSPKGHLRCAA
jgi:hypothetical protein